MSASCNLLALAGVRQPHLAAKRASPWGTKATWLHHSQRQCDLARLHSAAGLRSPCSCIFRCTTGVFLQLSAMCRKCSHTGAPANLHGGGAQAGTAGVEGDPASQGLPWFQAHHPICSSHSLLLNSPSVTGQVGGHAPAWNNQPKAGFRFSLCMRFLGPCPRRLGLQKGTNPACLHQSWAPVARQEEAQGPRRESPQFRVSLTSAGRQDWAAPFHT